MEIASTYQVFSVKSKIGDFTTTTPPRKVPQAAVFEDNNKDTLNINNNKSVNLKNTENLNKQDSQKLPVGAASNQKQFLKLIETKDTNSKNNINNTLLTGGQVVIENIKKTAQTVSIQNLLGLRIDSKV